MDDQNKELETQQDHQPERREELNEKPALGSEVETPDKAAWQIEQAWNDELLSEYELNEVIESLCLSKVEEFQMLGYEYVSGKEIWDCVSDKYRKRGVPPLHQIVNDILSLKSTQFMNWMTMSVYKGTQL